MPLGYDTLDNLVNLGDTADLRAYLDNSHGQKLNPGDVLSVIFTIQAPDGTQNVYQGIVEDDGAGICKYNDTVLEGHYVAVASFTLGDGSIKSTKTNFTVQSPFTEPLLFPEDNEGLVGQAVWGKISDLFDSEDGGPWLREMTLRYFNPSKMSLFINEALFDFNMNNPPSPGQYQLIDFAPDPNGTENPMFPLIVEGTFLAVVRHLMRSYTEQPLPQGGQITYEDRRDYQMRWKAIYDVESAMYARWVSMAKRANFGFGRGSSTYWSYSRGLWGLRFNRGWGIGPGGW